MNQREISGWVMYDWANSAFAATVVTAFLGPYLAALIAARPSGILPLGPYQIEPEAFYPFCVTGSVMLQFVCLPLLGALATCLLGLVSSGEWVLFGGLLFILANFAFGAAVVFYNAYLPEIALPEAQDRISSTGLPLAMWVAGCVPRRRFGVGLPPKRCSWAVRRRLAARCLPRWCPPSKNPSTSACMKSANEAPRRLGRWFLAWWCSLGAAPAAPCCRSFSFLWWAARSCSLPTFARASAMLATTCLFWFRIGHRGHRGLRDFLFLSVPSVVKKSPDLLKIEDCLFETSGS